jgi:hypothetical protein
MQSLRNAVFSAPTSFLVLASCRQAVRLACFAAASPAAGPAVAGVTVAADGAVADGAVADGAVADDAVAADCAAVRVIADCTANTNTHRLIPLAANPSRIPTSKPTRVETLLG